MRRIYTKAGDLIVEFTGKMIIKKKDRPDDRGSCGHWLVNHIEEVINTSENTGEIFDRLHITIDLKEAK